MAENKRVITLELSDEERKLYESFKATKAKMKRKMIENRLLLKKAKAAGLKITDAEIDAVLNKK